MHGVLNGEGVAHIQAKAVVRIGGELRSHYESIMFSIINKNEKNVYNSEH